MPTINFGKYAGLDIRDVPEDYLEWLIRSSKERMEECETELKRREQAAEANMSWMEKIIKNGFKDLAKRHHPDMGGTTAEMQELNAAYEALMGQARGRK